MLHTLWWSEIAGWTIHQLLMVFQGFSNKNLVIFQKIWCFSIKYGFSKKHLVIFQPAKCERSLEPKFHGQTPWLQGIASKTWHHQLGFPRPGTADAQGGWWRVGGGSWWSMVMVVEPGWWWSMVPFLMLHGAFDGSCLSDGDHLLKAVTLGVRVGSWWKLVPILNEAENLQQRMKHQLGDIYCIQISFRSSLVIREFSPRSWASKWCFSK